MGRRAIGAMPRVCVVEPSKNARVRIGGRAFWLGPCPNGKVTQSQVAEASRLWQEFCQGNQAPPQPARLSFPAATLTPSEPPRPLQPMRRSPSRRSAFAITTTASPTTAGPMAR